MNENQTLKELEEIGKKIDQIENKLEAIPNVVSDDKSDVAKYNRKQRRQMQRIMIRQEKEKQKILKQKGESFVTRREFVGLFQSMQKLRDRLYYVDILTAAMQEFLIVKNIITEEEFAEYIKRESEKAMAFQEIQKGQKDYENRLKKCIELKIDPNISVISGQIYEDSELDTDEKQRLAKDYNLKELLKIFEKVED